MEEAGVSLSDMLNVSRGYCTTKLNEYL